MIPKPKYIEDILEITESGKGFIKCDVVCKCGSKHFVGFYNILEKTKEQEEYEKQLQVFFRKHKNVKVSTENGVEYLCGRKSIFHKTVEKIESKKFDNTEIIKAKCVCCGNEYVLFDSRFNGYDANLPERESAYDANTYRFEKIKWKNDDEGAVTFSVSISGEDSLNDFVDKAYETDFEKYSNSFENISIDVKNVKTDEIITVLDIETA